jgi:hypothetical protein
MRPDSKFTGEDLRKGLLSRRDRVVALPRLLDENATWSDAEVAAPVKRLVSAIGIRGQSCRLDTPADKLPCDRMLLSENWHAGCPENRLRGSQH